MINNKKDDTATELFNRSWYPPLMVPSLMVPSLMPFSSFCYCIRSAFVFLSRSTPKFFLFHKKPCRTNNIILKVKNSFF